MRDLLGNMVERNLSRNSKRIISWVRELDGLLNDIYSKESTDEQVVNALEEALDTVSLINSLHLTIHNNEDS